MRILYGVVGEGMGHATRSKVTIEHLLKRGHEVKVVVSGRAHGFLAESFSDVVAIRGLTIRYVDNAMDTRGSVARNLIAAPEMLLENVAAYYDQVLDFAPNAVITDFDSFAYLYARRHDIPILSIDNQQIINRCKHARAIKSGARADYQLRKAFVKAKLPRCDHYVVTTFFYPQVRKKYARSTTLVPPILRRAVLDARARASSGDHVLVYQTSSSDTRIVQRLNQVQNTKFIVYGLKRNERHGNCTLKEFSEDGFVDDLARARAVVTNGGLSLIGEALYLGKPVYSIPVRHQFEQLMNARYLEELGYGLTTDELEPDVLRLFLGEHAKYASRVGRHEQDGNKLLFAAVDRWLRNSHAFQGKGEGERSSS